MRGVVAYFSQSLFLASNMRLSAVESTMSESQLEGSLSASTGVGGVMSSSREARHVQLRSLSDADDEERTLRERDLLGDEDDALLDPAHSTSVAAPPPAAASSASAEARALWMPASTAPARSALERQASSSQLDDLPLMSISDGPPREQQSSATGPSLAFNSP